jgi:guanylate kinase
MAEPGRAGGQGGAGPAPRPNRAALHGARVLLGVSGGIAAYKAAEPRAFMVFITPPSLQELDEDKLNW